MLFCFSTVLAMLEYLPQHIFSLTGSLAASYVYLGLSTVVDALLPPLLATVVLVRFCDVGTGRATLGCLAVSSSRVFFYLPYFYMYFYGMGADSIDALLLGAGVALIAVLAFFGYVMLLYLFARLMHRAQRARVGSKNLTCESLYVALKSGDVFDFAVLVGELDVADVGVVVAARELGVAALECHNALLVAAVLVGVGADISARLGVMPCGADGASVGNLMLLPGESAVAGGDIDRLALVVWLVFTRDAVDSDLAVIGDAQTSVRIGGLNGYHRGLVYCEEKFSVLLGKIFLYCFKIAFHCYLIRTVEDAGPYISYFSSVHLMAR